MRKRTFTAEFKSRLVLELLTGEKDLNALASENEIAPNQLRNWKNEFLRNAPAVFNDKRSDELKEELAEKEKEADELAKKLGRVMIENEWLKKTYAEVQSRRKN